MKVLSLWQPWAQLVICGAKRLETRSWPLGNTPCRLAIHASKKTAELHRLFATPHFLPDYKVERGDGSIVPMADADARAHAVRDYEAALMLGSLPFSAEDARSELRGKDLICWCKLDQACHADVLLGVANS